MKKNLTIEEYYDLNKNKIEELLNIFELENLTKEEKNALLLPLVDSTLKNWFTPPLSKMPNEIPSKTELHYHSRILLILLKYVLELNNKLDYLQKIGEQNEKSIQQYQQIIKLLVDIKNK